MNNLPEDIKIIQTVRPAAGMRRELKHRVEETVFTAYRDDEEIGHVTVDRWVEPDEARKNNPYFVDPSTEPPTPLPVIFNMRVMPNEQRKGIGTVLLMAANEHYSETHGLPLYSSLNPSTPSRENSYTGTIPLWRSLEKQGLAEEIECKGKLRFRFRAPE